MEENKFNQIIKSESFAFVSEIAEISLDNLIDNNIIKEIPIIGTITKLLSIGTSINDKFFVKKLLHFLTELEHIDQYLILKEIQYIDDSQKYSQRVGEKLLEIITRIDSDEKPKIIGILFKNFLLKKIEYNEFLKLSYLVENIFILDLLSLKQAENFPTPFTNKQGYSEYMKYLSRKKISPELYSYGIIEGIIPNQAPFPSDEFMDQNVRLTELGIKLFEFGMS